MLARDELQEGVYLDLLESPRHESRQKLAQLDRVLCRRLFAVDEAVQYDAPIVALDLVASLRSLEKGAD